MTKTSTSINLASSPISKPAEIAMDTAEQQDELFYNSIKTQLNELVKDPSDETIARILAYAKKK